MGKITDDELQKVAELKAETSQIINSLGELEYQKTNLEFLISDIKSKVRDLKNREIQFLNELRTKYGDVSINIETGEF